MVMQHTCVKLAAGDGVGGDNGSRSANVGVVRSSPPSSVCCGTGQPLLDGGLDYIPPSES